MICLVQSLIYKEKFRRSCQERGVVTAGLSGGGGGLRQHSPLFFFRKMVLRVKLQEGCWPWWLSSPGQQCCVSVHRWGVGMAESLDSECQFWPRERCFGDPQSVQGSRAAKEQSLQVDQVGGQRS